MYAGKDRVVISQILHINIPTAQGHLEGILKPEEAGVKPRYAALVCHPHPLGGGTMHNKVVFKVAQTLQLLGMPALRFNFRGVGHSSGSYDEGRAAAILDCRWYWAASRLAPTWGCGLPPSMIAYRL